MANDLIALLAATHWVLGTLVLVRFAMEGDAYARRLVAKAQVAWWSFVVAALLVVELWLRGWPATAVMIAVVWSAVWRVWRER